MGKRIDLTNKKFHKLTVLGYHGKSKWECQCSCGNKTIVRSSHLLSNKTKSCGCLRKQQKKKPSLEYVGKSFYHLTLLKFVKMRERKYENRIERDEIWKCQCECGNIKEIRLKDILRGHTKTCGCRMHVKGKNSPHWTGYNEISGHYWSSLQKPSHLNRGRKIPIPFSISIEYTWELFILQNKKCALSGMDISFKDQTASLDRIDSTKGYVEGNVQWVHKLINKMKMDIHQDVFVKMCNEVYHNYQSKKK